MKTSLSMKMQMRTSPQLVMAGELLRLSGTDLEHRVCQELKENPALEPINSQSTWDYFQGKSFGQHSCIHVRRESGLEGDQRENSTLDEYLERVALRQPVLSQLSDQIALLVNGEDLEKATTLLYSLDSHGYLRTSPEQLASYLGMSLADIERLILVLHELEPPGVGARDLRECLLIQCRYLEAEGITCQLAHRILEQEWDDFAAQRWNHIVKKLGVSKEELESVQQFIARNFSPYPLAMGGGDLDDSVFINTADLIIHRHELDGETTFSLEIPAEETFKLRLSDAFTSLIEKPSFLEAGLSAQEFDWIQMQLERARLFIASLQKRWETIRRVGEYVIEFQKDFLKSGPFQLKPLTQAMVARALGCHESTVSRAVNQKVIQLPSGRLAPMEIFFDASLPVKAVLRQILAHDRQPISDQEMTERLARAGYSIARRTVAKYRSQINQVSGF